MFNLHNCPNCGHSIIWMNRTYYGKYFAECSKCHYVGKTTLFRVSAALSWNKESKEKYFNQAK